MKPNIRPFRGIVLVLCLWLAMMASMTVYVGCVSQSGQQIAVNTLYSAQRTATSAVDGYYDAVISGAAPTNSVPVVAQSYNRFQSGWLVALDMVQYNTNALAPPNVTVLLSDLLNAIAQAKGKAK